MDSIIFLLMSTSALLSWNHVFEQVFVVTLCSSTIPIVCLTPVLCVAAFCGPAISSLKQNGMLLPLERYISQAKSNPFVICSQQVYNQAIQQIAGPAWNAYANNRIVSQFLNCSYNKIRFGLLPKYVNQLCQSSPGEQIHIFTPLFLDENYSFIYF